MLDLFHTSRQEIEKRLDGKNIFILPMGSTEQHGPHLPHGTDTMLAMYLSQLIAEKTGGVLLPPLHYGYSWVWRDIPGSISIAQETVEILIKDIARSIAGSHKGKLLIINGHDANNASMKYAVRELSDEIDLEIFYFFYPDLTAIYSEYCESEKWHGLFHADEFETSLMLHAYPEDVHMDLAVREYPVKPKQYGYSPVSLGSISSSGVYGDSTMATAEKGKKMFELFTKNILEIIQEI